VSDRLTTHSRKKRLLNYEKEGCREGRRRKRCLCGENGFPSLNLDAFGCSPLGVIICAITSLSKRHKVEKGGGEYRVQVAGLRGGPSCDFGIEKA